MSTEILPIAKVRTTLALRLSDIQATRTSDPAWRGVGVISNINRDTTDVYEPPVTSTIAFPLPVPLALGFETTSGEVQQAADETGDRLLPQPLWTRHGGPNAFSRLDLLQDHFGTLAQRVSDALTRAALNAVFACVEGPVRAHLGLGAGSVVTPQMAIAFADPSGIPFLNFMNRLETDYKTEVGPLPDGFNTNTIKKIASTKTVMEIISLVFKELQDDLS